LPVPYFIRSRLPVLGVGVLGVILSLNFFVNDPTLKYVSTFITDFTNIVLFIMITLTLLIHLGIRNVRLVYQRKPGVWFGSLVLITILIIYFGSGLILGLSHPFMSFLTSYLRTPAMYSLFCLTAFWILSAFYRTFKLSSIMNLPLFICGILIILASGPIFAYYLPFTVPLKSYIIVNIAGGAGTGVYVGMGIGLIGTAIREIAGMEKGYLGIEEQ